MKVFKDGKLYVKGSVVDIEETPENHNIKFPILFLVVEKVI